VGKTLGVVVAHPDDDAYGVAAIVALHLSDPEFRFFLVHATDGEGGAIAEGSGATPDTLGAVCRVEDASAWRVLGRSPYRHEWFGYPDGGVPDAPFEERCGGVPDERIDIDIDTTDVAPLVRRAMQEHRTQWNDMNNPESTEEQRVKSVSRETEVIAWPPDRPGRVLRDVFEG